MKYSKNSLIFKISLLSISLLLTSAPVISSALPLMFPDFSSQPKSLVESLLTIPNFGIILALLIGPIIIRFLGKKPTVIIGLLIALVFGILPAFTTNFSLILIARFLLGMGIGLFNSLAVSLLAEFYNGDELSTMMGYQSMAGSLGGAGLAFGVGYLVTLGWQQTFLIYLLFLPVLILFTCFVKIGNHNNEATSDDAPKEIIAFNRSVIGLSLFIFLLFAFFMAYVIKLPEYILSNEIGAVSSVSIITGIGTLIAIPVGFFYGRLHKIFKHAILPIGLFLCTLGFFIVSVAQSLPVVLIAVIFLMCGFSCSIPFIYTWTAEVAPKNALNISYTCLIVATNIGVFCSPFILNIAGKIFNNDTPKFSMYVAGAGMFLLGIFIVVTFFFESKKTIKKSVGDAK